jgi:hypothetical protein
MIPLLIGIATGVLTIVIVSILKNVNKPVIYGLILSGIGFLYVGFTWMDFDQLVITIIQAIVFVFLAHSGIKRSIYILAAGYFLNGLWDLGYKYLASDQLIPPHYDIFCMAVDFIIGGFLVISKNRFALAA